MSKKIDLTNKIFYSLTVLREVLQRGNYGQVLWECACDCGGTNIVASSDLKRGRIKSCGCQQGPKKLPFGECALNALILNIKNGAKKRNIQFSLSKDDIISIINRDCHYCGIKPSNKFYHGHSNGFYKYNGIDRVNNSMGYTQENCLPCCKICNYMKHRNSKEEFISKIKQIYKNLRLEE